MSVTSFLKSLVVLRLIAAFKFLKALLVIGTGFGLLSLANPTLLAALQQFTDSLSDGFEQRLLRNLLAMLVGVPPERLHLFAVASFLYAGLFVVEGIGLWRGRLWAEWLTVIATSSFIPIELYELARVPRMKTVLVIVLNVLILAYLIWRMRRVVPGARQH
jgi:uncharacterized membrane protein (DUF2068 family)